MEVSNPSIASPRKKNTSNLCRLCGYDDDSTAAPPSSALVHIAALYSQLQEESRAKEIHFKKKIMDLIKEKDEVEAKNCDMTNTIAFLKSGKGKKGLEAIDEWKALVRSLQEDRNRLQKELEERKNGGEIDSNYAVAVDAVPDDKSTAAPKSMSAMMREDTNPPLDTKIANDRTLSNGSILMSIVRSVRGVIVGVIVGFRIFTAPSLPGKKTDDISEGDLVGDFCTEGAVII
jgi:hypothetical protein